jgi:hypothetical protein
MPRSSFVNEECASTFNSWTIGRNATMTFLSSYEIECFASVNVARARRSCKKMHVKCDVGSAALTCGRSSTENRQQIQFAYTSM